jgi:hypothetical protein
MVFHRGRKKRKASEAAEDRRKDLQKAAAEQQQKLDAEKVETVRSSSDFYISPKF